MATESVNSMKNDLRRCTTEQTALEQKLQSTRDELSENKISQIKYQAKNERLETDIKSMVEKHKDQLSQWTKGQTKCMNTLKDQHFEETRSQQKLIDNLRRTNTSLESDSTQRRRDLLSSQQRCSKLEKLFETREEECRDKTKTLLNRANDAEAQLDVFVKKEKNLKSTVSSLEEKLAVLQTDKEDEARHSTKVVEGLQREVTSLKDSNMELTTQVSQLHDEIATTKEVCVKQTQKIQQQTDHKVKQVEVECEALRVRNQKDNMAIKELEVSIEKQSELHQATVSQLVSDSKEKAIQLGNTIADEREVSKCLMIKVQETNATIQALTQENHQLTANCNKNINKLYEYERIIQAGELKLAHFGKQLSRSLHEQEARISLEATLKNQLNSMQLECERLKRQSGA